MSQKHNSNLRAGSDKNAINLFLEGQLQHNLPEIDHKSIREVIICFINAWVGIRAISITHVFARRISGEIIEGDF